MLSFSFAALIAPFALQAVPAPPEQGGAGARPEPSISSFDDLPIEQAAAPRCGLAFAVVAGWQKIEDPRGADYPDMESEGGREFFVRAMADLMDGSELSREALSAVVAREAGNLASPEGSERVQAMMPACLLMKQSAGL